MQMQKQKNETKQRRQRQRLRHEVVVVAAGDQEKPLLVAPGAFLSEEVVEKIIARIPYPLVFKARLLSNTWNCKFSPPLEIEAPRKSLTPFQMEVNSVSHKWPSYSPVFVAREGMRGFDRVSCQWKSMFPHWKLNVLDTHFVCPSYKCSCVGSRLLVSVFSKLPPSSSYLTNTFVLNVNTGSWTKLPQIQGSTATYEPEDLRLLPGDLNTFRVLQIDTIWNERLSRRELQTSLYDSKVGGWSSVTTFEDVREKPYDDGIVRVGLRLFYKNSVCLHGKLYCLCSPVNMRGGDMQLCVYHLDSDKTWAATGLSVTHDVINARVLLCGEKLMLVTYSSDREFFVYELDLKMLGSSGRLVTKRTIVPEPARGICKSFLRLASDDDFIYVGEYTSRNPVRTYNVHTGEWGTLPRVWAKKRSREEDKFITMLPCAFTPGLDPFAFGEPSDGRLELCD